jgi:predicted AAA+ superfamily ATPase
MIPRALLETVRDRLNRAPAVVLLGPRQVGKTTLARQVADEWGDQAIYLDLERVADRRRLDDADQYLRQLAGRLVILDELHRVPDLFPILRGIIDDRRQAGHRTGQFLLLGSASLELQRQAGESLAGRVSLLELTPVTLMEWADRGPADVLWLRGGFPESLLASDDAGSALWREDFIRSYLERDVPMFAPGLPAPTIGRLWRMLAHAQGTPLNKARLAANLDLTAPTIGRYLDLLEQLLLVRRLTPWSGNLGKRLVRTPKVYLRDSGLLHALLSLPRLDDLLGHPVVGGSWEGFVIEQLITAAGPQRQPLFYRTASGDEADLVFERGGTVELVVEIKRSSAPVPARGFHAAIAALRPHAAFVVHSGEGAWPMPGGIEAISVRELMQRLQRDTVLEQKLRVVRESARHGHPTGDIGQLLEDTARGRAGGEPGATGESPDGRSSGSRGRSR